ncbi:MAG TPA: hypothetical protein VNA25_13595 [Phycisphaerae bacterium]|nr:hypothetical protein [Phycisphaerae bacterium]
MTDAARLVKALRAGRTWQRVADLCNDGTGILHSAGYYQQVATGRIQEPSAETLAGIVRAPALAERLLKCDFSRVARFGLVVEHSRGLATNQWRKSRGLKWDQWFQEADELMREKYEEEA